MLTFHDWIIAGGNRLSLLDGVLSCLGEIGIRAATVGECWHDLIDRAVAPRVPNFAASLRLRQV